MPKLILTRQPQQAAHISHPDGRITIRVLNVSGPSVRLSFDAPESVEILREELAARPKPERSAGGAIPCTKCGKPSWTLDGLCFPCGQIENG